MTPAEIVERALSEDVGTGDITTELCVPSDRQASGAFRVRERIVVAGVELLPQLYEHIDFQVSDGAVLDPGQEIARSMAALARCLRGNEWL